MPVDYRQLRDLYLQSLDLSPQARAQFLAERLRGTDPKLRAELQRLWALDDAEAPEQATTTTSTPIDEAELERELRGLSGVREYPLLLEEVAGPYRILGTLGRGAASEVYHAEHLETGREVALKVLGRQADSTQMHERFEREVSALSKLRHPSVARLLGSGMLDSRFGPRPYLATELVEGLHADRWADQVQPTWSEVLDVFIQITAAVAAAHRLHIVHRDLKPANILIDRWNRPRVLDFGVSRLDDEDTGTLTHDGQVLGTPHTMAPEQALGRRHLIGPASDVYALGLIALRLWSGRDAVELGGLSFQECLPVVAAGVGTPLRELVPDIPRKLRRVLENCLRLDPHERYADADELLLDLQRVQRGRRPKLKLRRPKPTRFVVGAALLLSIASLWFARDLRRAQDTRPSQAEVVGSLSRLEELVQLGSRTEEDLRAAVALSRRIEADLNRVDRDGWTPWIERFLYWRRGEAHYFLASQLRDPREFESALAAWFLADLMGQLKLPDEPWPGSRMTQQNVVYITEQRPPQGMGLAHASMAFYHTPMLHLAQAEELRDKALRRLAQMRGAPDAAFDEIPLKQVDHELGFVILECGDTKAELARLRDDRALLRHGIAMMRYVEDRGLTRDAGPATASLHAALGSAYTTLVEMGVATAPMDSAELWLRRALEFRTAGYSLPLHVDSLRRLARFYRAAEQSSEHLAGLRRELSDAHGQLVFQDMPIEAALCALELVELELDLANDDGALDRAQNWLHRSRILADEGPFLRQAARWYLLTAREIRMRAAADGLVAADARDALAAARARVARSEDPGLHEEIDAEERALGG